MYYHLKLGMLSWAMLLLEPDWRGCCPSSLFSSLLWSFLQLVISFPLFVMLSLNPQLSGDLLEESLPKWNWMETKNGKVTLEHQSAARGKKELIKDFHTAITSWHSWPLSRWAKKSTERNTAQLSLSCKNTAVQNMTATALAGPLRGVEHFQGNDLKNDNAGSLCDINYTLCSWQIS